MKKKVAVVTGWDLSTTALSCGVRSKDGQEGFVSVPMRGKTEWRGQPAHDLWFVPSMMFDCLKFLMARGWIFSEGGVLSFSVRQHDMVLLNEDGNLFMPALSWQCNAADEETARINVLPKVVKSIGKVEPRFILPKLIWALRQSPAILSQVQTVMTTGDWITSRLTHAYFISTSDGLSNGLLDQGTKKLASAALARTCTSFNGFVGKPHGFVKLFPAVIQSGKIAGTVTSEGAYDGWHEVTNILNGWRVISSLGDNHAGAVGCGLPDDETMVISAGSSGTVVRRCSYNRELVGKAACFEYYNDRLLLMMLADCAAWYNKFTNWCSGPKPDIAALDQMAMEVPMRSIRFWPQEEREAILKTKRNPTEKMVANAQFSIALNLLLRVRDMLAEVKNQSSGVKGFVLTGGLSRSKFFQEVLAAGIHLLEKDATVFISSRKGPLASQAATLGAMINAMVGSGLYKDLPTAIAELCPLKPLHEIGDKRLKALENLIRAS